MRRIVGAAIGLCCFMLTVSSGCATTKTEFAYWGETIAALATQKTNSVQSEADRMHTHQRVAKRDATSLVEDVDYILLRDRPSRLSRWHNQ